VAVEASHRRIGIAQALGKEFAGTAMRLGLREATLEVTNANRQAIRFYSGQGFAALEGEALARYVAEKARAATVRQNQLIEPGGASFLVMRLTIEAGS
jgi:ribosomal protein S18 acetylase RimI-like enzyme